MDLVDILVNTFDFLLEIPDKVKKCVHEQVTHEKRNNLIEYKRKKAIIDKLKEKYGLDGDGKEDSWCNVKYKLGEDSYVIMHCDNATYRTCMDEHFSFLKDLHWVCSEPADLNQPIYFSPFQKDDYIIQWDGPEYIKDSEVTFERAEKELVRLIERMKALKAEYKELKAKDDFDSTAALFESLKSHYHLIEPEKSINATRYAYSPDIRYFVISYCKARNKIYVPSGLEQQEIVLGGLETFTLPDCWEMKCNEQTISATTFDEYKKYLDGILKQYKNLEQSKWDKYDI